MATKRFLDCNVLCFNEKQEELTGKKNDLWLPLCIDLDFVFAVKQNGGEDNEDNAVIWHKCGDYFVIDIKYKQMVEIWKRYHNIL